MTILLALKKIPDKIRARVNNSKLFKVFSCREVVSKYSIFDKIPAVLVGFLLADNF
jgi:hypothetical protein